MARLWRDYLKYDFDRHIMSTCYNLDEAKVSEYIVGFVLVEMSISTNPIQYIVICTKIRAEVDDLES